MTHQELLLTHTIHRFELKNNSYQRAYENAFNLYGVLIIPILLGGILMYNVFQLRDEYFVIPFLLLVFFLGNLYIFSQRMMYKNYTLKLIINNDYIQILDREQIYFQGDLAHVSIEVIRYGKKLKSAIQLTNEDLGSIILGLKDTELNNIIYTENKLCLPDYSISTKRQSNLLLSLLRKNYQ